MPDAVTPMHTANTVGCADPMKAENVHLTARRRLRIIAILRRASLLPLSKAGKINCAAALIWIL